MTPADPDYVEQGLQKIERFERRASTLSGREPKNTLFQPRNGAATMQTETIEQQPRLEAKPPQLTRHRTRLPDNVLNGEPATVHVPAELKINGETTVAPAAPTSLLDVILAAGSNKDFDVEKFERLVQIQRAEQDRQDARADKQAELAAEAAFDVALSDVQGKIAPIVANQYNSQTRSRYADYAALDRIIKPIYSPAGFRLSFDEEDSPKAEHVRVVCWVTHVAPGAKRSHKQKFHADIPADGKGARGGDVMTRTHATKSAFTYGKGIVACNIFNIAIDKDDDGNAASARRAPASNDAPPDPGCISTAQAQTICALLDERRVSHRAFLQHIKLDRIEDIGVEHFDRAIAKIKTFGARR